MKNKNFKKLVAVCTLILVCGVTAGCGNGQGKEADEEAVVSVKEDAEQEAKAEEKSEETPAAESAEESKPTEEAAKESTEESKSVTESTEASMPVAAVTMDGQWTDMEFELAGKTYQLPLAYAELEAEGWTFDLADYGYEGGYEMEPGDKVYATIDLTNPAYDEDLSLRVGFKNYSDGVLDIKECDIWSLEMDTCYGRKQLPSYPSMTIGNGLTIGCSKSDVETLCGAYEDIYESESGYVKYTYSADDYTLKITVYEEMGVTCMGLSTYE